MHEVFDGEIWPNDVVLRVGAEVGAHAPVVTHLAAKHTPVGIPVEWDEHRAGLRRPDLLNRRAEVDRVLGVA